MPKNPAVEVIPLFRAGFVAGGALVTADAVTSKVYTSQAPATPGPSNRTP